MDAFIKQLQSLALTEALPFLLKAGRRLVLWFVGRAIINGFRRVLTLALHKRQLDATLIRYVESLFSGSLAVLLLLGLLGLMGVETTSFAALLAAAGIAIGSAWAGLLANFAAGIFLLVLRPFRWAMKSPPPASPASCMRSACSPPPLDTPDNLRIFVGNNRLFGDNIINYTHHPHRRLAIKVPVHARQRRRGRPARPACNGAAVPACLPTPAPSVGVAEFTAARARARRPNLLVPSPQRQRRAGRHGPRHPGGHRRGRVRRPPELALDPSPRRAEPAARPGRPC